MAQDRTIRIDLGIKRNDFSGRETRAELELETSKAVRGGCASKATVFWVGFCSRSHSFAFGEGGDYSKTIATVQGAATQKNIDRCHEKAFPPEAVELLTAEVKAFYAAEDAKTMKFHEDVAVIS
jgi:hypothetical protein